jgi:hypothetical protein
VSPRSKHDGQELKKELTWWLSLQAWARVRGPARGTGVGVDASLVLKSSSPCPTTPHPPWRCPARHGRARPCPALPWPWHTQPHFAMAMPHQCSCFFLVVPKKYYNYTFLVFVVYLLYKSLKIFIYSIWVQGYRRQFQPKSLFMDVELRCKPNAFSQLHVGRSDLLWSYSTVELVLQIRVFRSRALPNRPLVFPPWFRRCYFPYLRTSFLWR